MEMRQGVAGVAVIALVDDTEVGSLGDEITGLLDAIQLLTS